MINFQKIHEPQGWLQQAQCCPFSRSAVVARALRAAQFCLVPGMRACAWSARNPILECAHVPGVHAVQCFLVPGVRASPCVAHSPIFLVLGCMHPILKCAQPTLLVPGMRACACGARSPILECAHVPVVRAAQFWSVRMYLGCVQSPVSLFLGCAHLLVLRTPRSSLYLGCTHPILKCAQPTFLVPGMRACACVACMQNIFIFSSCN